MHPALGLAWTSALVPGRGGRWAGLRFGVAAEGVPGSAQSQPRRGGKCGETSPPFPERLLFGIGSCFNILQALLLPFT